MFPGGASDCHYPRKAKGGKRTHRTNRLRLSPEAGNGMDGGYPPEDVKLQSGFFSPSPSSDSTTDPGTPPGVSPPPGFSQGQMEERIWKMMEELSIKTKSLHATELRAQAAEQKWMELQAQVMKNRIMVDNTPTGRGMPPNIGFPQPAANPWEARSYNGNEAYLAMLPDQSMPLPVGPVTPHVDDRQVAMKPKKKAASQQTAAPVGAGVGLLSRGSKNHALSRCRPCSLFYSPKGCPDGAQCNFCHYPHSNAKLLEAAMYSAKAAEKRSMQMQCAKSVQAEFANLAAAPPPASAVPQPKGMLGRLSKSEDTESTESTADCTGSQAGDSIWSDTIAL